MARNETTSIVIDEIIRLVAMSATLGATLLAPNILLGLEKPLNRLFTHLDVRDRELAKQREVKRIIRYMKSQGYLAGDYEHGLKLTKKAQQRIAQRDIDTLQTTVPEKWDNIWRIVVYDIPNSFTENRREIQRRLRFYGCFQLQRSVLITPFPCFEDIATLAARCNVEQYLTYFETTKLANDRPLIARFAKKYPKTRFK